VGVLAAVRSRLAAMLSPIGMGGWWPAVREPYTGAWQLNDVVTTESPLLNPSFFACVSRIAQDVAKIAPPDLVEETSPDIWEPTRNPAYSPVLEHPNSYQTPQQFYEQWVLSKLLTGNTYVLLERDDRGVVNGMHVLRPEAVKILESPDGGVYYELQANTLAGLPSEGTPHVVSAREIAHDRWNCFGHALAGTTPLSALTGAIVQAKYIQDSGTGFFAKGGRPGGVLIAPTKMDPLSAARIKTDVANLKAGDILVAELGMKWEPSATSPVDAQVIQQLGWTEEKVAQVFGMPISILNSSKQPPYANAEASQLQYKQACLEPHLISIQNILNQALSLPSHLWVQFDVDLLIAMDTATRVAAVKDAISAGAMSPNEARKRLNLPPVAGGEYPVLQQQNWPLPTLATRESPTVPPAPAPVGDRAPEEAPV
jgi:HK97 family phage portal protein